MNTVLCADGYDTKIWIKGRRRIGNGIGWEHLVTNKEIRQGKDCSQIGQLDN